MSVDIAAVKRPLSTAPRGRKGQAALAGVAKKENTRAIAHQIAEMREDYQCQFAKWVITANLRSVPVSVSVEQAEGATQQDARAEALADHLQKLWMASRSAMEECFDYGRVAFEKIHDGDVDRGLTIIEKLDPMPYEMTELKLDKGAYNGFDLRAKGEPVHIDAAASWWLALDPTALEPHGKSRFTGAPHKVFRQRKAAIGFREIWVEKFAIGCAKAHVQSSFEDPATGQLVDGHARMQEAYDAYKSGGLLTFDNARVRKADGTEGEYKDDIEQMPVQADGSPLDETIDGLDADQLQAFGVPPKTVIEGEAVGSYAMVTQQMRVLFAVVDDILSQMVASFQKYVVDKLVALNFAENPPKIVVSYPPLADRPDSLILELAKAMLTNPSLSPLVTQQGIDVRQILEQAGIPIAPDLEAKLDKAQMAAERAAMMESQARAQQGPQLRLANEDAPPVNLPDRRQLQEDTVDALNSLLEELVIAFGQKKADKVASLLDQIRELQVQASVAAKLLGMLSPWRPSLQANPAGHGRQKPLALANDTDGFVFPWIKSAFDWLKGKVTLPASDVEHFTTLERAAVFSAAGIDDAVILNDLQSAVADSLALGEDFRTFRKKADEKFGLTRSQLETTYRTHTKQAYLAGMEQTLSQPAVQEAFPYVRYAATADTRVRDSHWELDGMVARRGSPLHQLMLSALADYNCRCTLIPLSKEDGSSRKLSDVQDVPEYVRSIYS